jgi:hypothetical protein
VEELLKRFGASPAEAGTSPWGAQFRAFRARLRPKIPSRKKTTIAIDAGLIGPTELDSGRNPPMTATLTTTMTSIDSTAG